MNKYSQHTPGYQNVPLGRCTGSTMWGFGCFVTSLAMLAYMDPLEVNDKLTEEGGYAQGCLLVSSKAAKILDLKYDGRVKEKPNHICIAETNHYKSSGVPQHFFVFAPKGTVSTEEDLMLDPLDSPRNVDWKKVKYRIVSYRLFHEKKPDTEFDDAWQEMLDLGVYSEYTQKNVLVTTQQLAVFLSRFKSSLDK